MQTLFRALRSLRRSPAVSAVVVLSIGSALGLSTSLLAVIDSVTHPIVPFDQPNHLFTVFPYRTTASPSGPTALDQLQTLSSLDGVESVSASIPDPSYLVKVNDKFVQGVGFTSRTARGFFETLGARPRIGRLPDNREVAEERAVVVSDELWRRAFGNRASIDDATIEIGGRLYAVVGVMPPHTALPQWRVEIWLPMNSNQYLARRAGAQFVVRTHEGTSRPQLEAKLAGVANAFSQTLPANRGAELPPI